MKAQRLPLASTGTSAPQILRRIHHRDTHGIPDLAGHKWPARPRLVPARGGAPAYEPVSLNRVQPQSAEPFPLDAVLAAVVIPYLSLHALLVASMFLCNNSGPLRTPIDPHWFGPLSLRWSVRSRRASGTAALVLCLVI